MYIVHVHLRDAKFNITHFDKTNTKKLGRAKPHQVRTFGVNVPSQFLLHGFHSALEIMHKKSNDGYFKRIAFKGHNLLERL